MRTACKVRRRDRNIQGTDRDGEVAYTARLQYSDGGDSTILMSSHYSYTANSGPGEDELWSEGCAACTPRA